MKKILLASTALVAAAMAVPAGAADMRPALKAPPPVVRPACAQFGGFYVGGHVGWGHYDYSFNDQDAWIKRVGDSELPDHISTTRTGWLAGVAGGFNWQTGCSLWGVEADISWTNLKAFKDHSDGWNTTPSTFVNVESRLRAIGTLRTRLGVVVDSVLLYVTGGLAVANFRRHHAVFTSCCDEFSETTGFDRRSKTRWGGVVGVGAEWAWTPNVSIKSEFLYAKFQRHREHLTSLNDSAEHARFEHNDSVLMSRIGINFRFGGFGLGAPVAARY